MPLKQLETHKFEKALFLAFSSGQKVVMNRADFLCRKFLVRIFRFAFARALRLASRCAERDGW